MNPQYDPSLLDKVPPSIVSAAMAVSNWFNSQSLHPSPRWEFLSICSRNHADRLKKLERELDSATTNEAIATNENHKLKQRIAHLEDRIELLMSANADVARIAGERDKAEKRVLYLESALRMIANADYRGNRSTESQIAFQALKEAKL